MFGRLSKFFAAYTHSTLECKVRILPYAYVYTHQEIVFTKSKKALISHTPLRNHPFANPVNAGRLGKFFFRIRLIKQWIRFYLDALFAKKYNASVALLTREVAFSHYGHFLKETLAGYYQLKIAQKEPDFYILPLQTPFQKEVYKMLGIESSTIIPSHARKLICAKELIIPTLIADYEILEYRKHLHFETFVLPPFTYTMHQELFAKILDKTKHITPHRKIFLSRPPNSNRNFINHQEIECVMREYGFEIILPDKLSVEQQILLFSEVKYVVSLHGAGLNNLLFAKEKTKVLEIFSQYYHDRGVQLVALAKGCEYHYLIASTDDISMHPQQECAYLSINELCKALSILLES